MAPNEQKIAVDIVSSDPQDQLQAVTAIRKFLDTKHGTNLVVNAGFVPRLVSLLAAADSSLALQVSYTTL